MKKRLSALIALTVLLSGCFWNKPIESEKQHTASDSGAEQGASKKEERIFTKNEKGNLVSDAGVEYTFLTYEDTLCYFGEAEFLGGVQGEPSSFHHGDFEIQTGMFALENDETQNVLIRHTPDNEWYAIYRKTSLPPLDYAVDNCIRLELILGSAYYRDGVHVTCGHGMIAPDEIAAFLSDVRAQKTADEAGLYGDGMPENCYEYGTIFGFFEEEPNVAFPMAVWSFNDQAYSVCIEDKEYVLPEKWLKKFMLH